VTAGKIGVLVMSYGTPETMEQVEDYYTHIRRGRKPAPELLQELIGRYEAIGGVSPLRAHTDAQTAALQRRLDERMPGVFVCRQGMKHARPFIEDGVAALAEEGLRRGIGIVLAPHYSALSVGEYIQRAREAAGRHGIGMAFVESYHLHPLFIAAHAGRLRAELERFPEGDRERVHVFFTAHSLPARILQMQDPYPDQLLESSRAIGEAAGVRNWSFAWQSAGRTNEPWLGPDLLEAMECLDRKATSGVVVVPVGFVSDHLEVLYDLDIEARAHAGRLGFRFARTAMLNDDPAYIETLADAILAVRPEPEGDGRP